MKRLKCILLAAIVAAMMVPSFSFAALAQPGDDIESPTWSDDMTIYFPQQISKKYNGKKPNIPVAMFVNGKYEGLYKSPDGQILTTDSANIGSYEVFIPGTDFSFIYTIKPGDNEVTVLDKAGNEFADVTLAYASVKKASKTIRVGKVKSLSGGKVTYKSLSKGITVSSKGVIKVKKGMKPGTYQIKVTCKAKGNYATGTKIINIIVTE